ncbi:MAG: XdhC family protein [Acidimicrobiales bacterium]
MSRQHDGMRELADRLSGERRAFVSATVVRAERPTSAKAGDTAIVMEDGTIVGFVGGECAAASVQAHALGVLASGLPLLLRITPDGEATGRRPATGGSGTTGDGALTVHNPCLSGGSLEIFLEPVRPPVLVVVYGEAPIARAVSDLTGWLGWEARPWSPEGLPIGAAAVVIASHGGDEASVVRSALDAGVSYIGLVASRRRAAGVLDTLGLQGDDRERVRSPAGLDIGSRAPEEVALSILAEVMSSRPRPPQADRAGPVTNGPAPDGPGGEVPLSTDPVCGMAVVAIPSSRHVEHDGSVVYFCGPGCEQAFLANPGGYRAR